MVICVNGNDYRFSCINASRSAATCSSFSPPTWTVTVSPLLMPRPIRANILRASAFLPSFSIVTVHGTHCLRQFCDRYTLEQIAGCAATIDSYVISPYLCLNANPFFFRVTYTYANCKYKETDQQNARICTDFRPTLEQNVAA